MTESQNLAAKCEKEVEGLNEKLQSADIEYASQKQLLMQEMERESQAHTKILHKKEEQLRELESENLRLEVPVGFFKLTRLLQAWELVMQVQILTPSEFSFSWWSGFRWLAAQREYVCFAENGADDVYESVCELSCE